MLRALEKVRVDNSQQRELRKKAEEAFESLKGEQKKTIRDMMADQSLFLDAVKQILEQQEPITVSVALDKKTAVRDFEGM